MDKDFFNDEDVKFGHFSDMVSAHARDRTYFRIGLIDERVNNKSGTSISGMLLTYREHGGLPELSRLSRTMGSHCVHLRIEEKTSYKSQELPQGAQAHGVAYRVINDWINEHSSDGAGYKFLTLPDGGKELPLLVMLSWAMQAPADKKRTSFAFSPQWFPPEVVWVAPIRTKPRRTYDELQSAFSAEGSHTPYLIKRILDSESEAQKFQEFITKAGAASGLFQSIEIKRFGTEVTAPFEVDVVLDDKALNLSTVGYGVSQSLPIFVELLVRPSGSVFAIQQPEVHLHPRAQAALGDVFFELAIKDKKSFLIETHSDFTIDRFRMNYRKKGSKLKSQILFFERSNKMNTVTALTINSNGDLPSEQPDNYRRFFIKEEMRLLGL